MLTRWRFRRSSGDAAYPVLAWSRVPVGTAAITHTGTASPTAPGATSSAAGTVGIAGTGNATAPNASCLAFGTAARPAPAGPSVIPHDDYWDEDARPWWDRRRNQEAEKATLDAMRAEIGLLPRRAAAEVRRAAEGAVAKASKRLAKADKSARVFDERRAFDLVAAQEREYRKAFRSVLAQLRADDLVETFRAEVRASLREERKREVEADDAEIMRLLEEVI